MRLLSLLSRIAGYGAFWVAIVLACGVVGMFLPLLWTIGQPSSSEDYGLGMTMGFFAFLGLVAGTLPATLGVSLLTQRKARRLRRVPFVQVNGGPNKFLERTVEDKAPSQNAGARAAQLNR